MFIQLPPTSIVTAMKLGGRRKGASRNRKLPSMLKLLNIHSLDF
jgi:hypothetical protein